MPFEKIDPLGSYLGTKAKMQQLDQGKQRLEAGKQNMELKGQQAEQQQKTQQRKILVDMGNAAKWADTPEKWDQVLDTYENAGQDVENYRGGFELRESVMALAAPEKDQDIALRKLKLAEDKFKQIKTGAQVILEDGTIVQSTSAGRRVYGPEGNILKGKEAAKAIEDAQAEKVSNLRKAAGGKRMATLEADQELKAKVEAGVVNAKEAAKASIKAFEKFDKINVSISNIDEAIKALDEGAKTGVMMSYVKSVRASSIKLDNIQKRMGMDIIGAVTFGALSKGELDLALATALPTTMKPADLKVWLTDKKAAQTAVADYLESAAIYLGTPGNTHASWMKHLKSKKQKQDEPANVQSLIDKYADK